MELFKRILNTSVETFHENAASYHISADVSRVPGAEKLSRQEAETLITALNENLGSDEVSFYPGISYRHICKLKGYENALKARCT